MMGSMQNMMNSWTNTGVWQAWWVWYLLVWVGIILITIWFVNYVRETKEKIYLVVGLIILLASLFAAGLGTTGHMARHEIESCQIGTGAHSASAVQCQ